MNWSRYANPVKKKTYSWSARKFVAGLPTKMVLVAPDGTDTSWSVVKKDYYWVPRAGRRAMSETDDTLEAGIAVVEALARVRTR